MSKEKKTKKKEQRTYIGGQAVLEGVMMRGKTSYATAVRDPEGNIQVEKKRLSISKHMRRASKIPLVRGVVNFVSSLLTGSKILMRSAEVYGDTDEPSKFEIWCRDKLHINVMSAISVIATVLGVALAVGLFVALPMLLANLIFSENLRFGNVWYNLTQGGLRLVIFILYIVAISAMKDIRRVFMYHGAEHKTITCFEKGLDLTPENAKTCSRIHDRCGTTFMFLVMAVSIVVFSIINWLCDEYLNIFVYNNVVNYLIQFAVKLLFIPLVAGLSYEVLKLLAKSQSKILLPVKAPGFLLQRLTTREPDDSMLEVAIAAFNSVYQMDSDPSIPESEFTVSMTVRKYVETLKEKFKAASIDESDAEWLVACSSGIARSELYTSEKMFVPTEVSRMDKIARERLGGRPLWYILGDTEFYGYKIKVDERVLIPRPETELLAEIAVKTYEEGDKVLDLCTGSGAVAIAIAKQKNISVAAADVSADALALAEENARANGADVKFVESDLFAKIKGKYNIITCNPPYVKSADMKTLPKEVGFEPAMALDGGEDGLDFYRRLAKESPKHLVRGGALIMECGIGQAQEIVKLFSKFDYTMVTRDLEGVERIVRAVY